MLHKKYSLFFTLLLSFACLTAGVAQEPDSQEVSASFAFEQQLLTLRETLRSKEKEKKVLESKLKTEKDEVTLEQLQQELSAAEDIILGVREEVVTLATGGAKLFSEPPVVKKDFNWEEDLELIFEPLLDQLREVSERPRLIEELEANIVYWEGREKELALALSNLQGSMESVKDKALKKELKELLDTANSRYTSAQQKLSLLNNELVSLKSAKNPVWSTLGSIVTGVFVEMIFHFMLALLAGFLIFQLVRLLSIIVLSFINKAEPKEYIFVQRTVELVRTLIGSVFALLTYIVILYSLTEWLLLVFSLLVMAGFALGLKEALPTYLMEIKTLLNLGSVRQDERLIYHGLPWKIKRLNVHTRLHNPALHGYLRVPIIKLLNLSSRPFHNDEPWFPTKVGDVVKMEDGVFGKVSRQTPDIVEIDFGDSIYTYRTNDFLAKRPRNLSQNGFTIHEVFGIDYSHQSEVTSKILAIYKTAIKEAVANSIYSSNMTTLEVEFDNASDSSLDFRVLVGFDGTVAGDYFKIKRLLQKASVEAANKNDWVIPFPQMMVHHQSVSS